MASTPKYERDARAAAKAVLDYQPPLTLRLIRRGLLSLVIIAVLGIAYTVYWFLIATNMKDGVPAWLADRAGPGINFAYRQIEISGYPFSFRIIFREPSAASVQLSAVPGGESWRWKADRVTAAMKPWNFNHFELDLSGKHEFDVALPAVQGRYAGTIKQALVETEIYADGKPRYVRLSVKDGALKGMRQGDAISASMLNISARRLFPEPVTNKSATFVLDMNGRQITLPAALRWPLGQKITLFKGKARFLGGLENPQSLKSIAAWRDDGGIVELDSVEVKYGPLTALANGTLALDKNLQPMGALSARFQGFFATVDRLRKAQIIRSRDAAMAKVVLGVLSRRPPDGGPATVSVPINIQDGKLTAQQITLMELAPIQWPDSWKEQDGFRRLKFN